MRVAWASLAVVAALASAATAAHVDVVPYYELDASGKHSLNVGSYDLAGSSDGTQSIRRQVLAFSGEASPGPGGVPDGSGSRLNGDPGWNRPVDFAEGDGFGADYPDGTMPVGYGSLGFNVVVDPRLGRNLSYWDGQGSPAFGPVPGGEILDLFKPNPLGPPERVVTIAGEAAGAPGFVVSDGLFPAFHEHTSAVLWGSPTRTAGEYPTAGFYLYSLEMEVKNDLYSPPPDFLVVPLGDHVSPAFHLLIAVDFPKYAYETEIIGYEDVPLFDEEGNPLLDNNGEPLVETVPIEVTHELTAPKMQAAIDWVNANLQPVPEPSTICLAYCCAATFLATRVLRRAYPRASA